MKRMLVSGCVGATIYSIICIFALQVMPNAVISLSEELNAELYRNYLVCFLLFGFFTFAFYTAYQHKIIKWWVAILLHYLSYVGGIVFILFFLKIWEFDLYRLALVINFVSLFYFTVFTILKINDYKTQKHMMMK